MADINDPLAPSTPSPSPFGAGTSSSVTPSPASAAAPTNTDHMTVKKGTKKSTLVLLILLLLIGAGAGYYYYTNMQPATPPVGADVPMIGMDTNEMSGNAVTGNDTALTTGDSETVITGEETTPTISSKMEVLENINMILSDYYSDNNVYPADFSAVEAQSAAMLTMQPENILRSGFNRTSTTNDIIYSSLYRNGVAQKGAIVMVRVDDPNEANRIDAEPALTQVSDISKADAGKIEKMICAMISVDETTVDSLTKCTAKE